MSSVMYKPGQGYWTRLMSALAWGVLVAFAAMWLWNQLETINVPQDQLVFVQGGATAAIMLLGGALVYWLIYIKSGTGEFLIATDGEMRKVNWSTRREIMGFARKKLGPGVAPREIEFIDSLPKTRSGKIMRRLLKARELGLDEGDTSTLEDD